jgi:hypothetical protein
MIIAMNEPKFTNILKLISSAIDTLNNSLKIITCPLDDIGSGSVKP